MWRTKLLASIRGWLVTVTVATAVSSFLIGALAGWYSWHQQKLRLGQSLVATSRALIDSADRELEQGKVALRALSKSLLLQRADFAAFQQQAAEVLQPYGYFLIVSEPGSSHELLNTRIPYVAPRPELPPEWRTAPRAVGMMEVRPLVLSGMSEWIIALQMLASTESGTTHLLTLAVPWERFQQIIQGQRLPSEWSPVILDQNWTIVARGIDPQKFIGQKGANAQLKDVAPADSVYEAQVLEGYSTMHARSRSTTYGWTAAVAVPQRLLAIDFLGPAAFAGLAGFLISLLGTGAFAFFSHVLARDVDALSRSTMRFANGDLHSLPEFQFREVAAVAKEIERAAERVQAEESFRRNVVQELSHRLRNKVATIQAIVRFQLQDYPALLSNVSNCLKALAATDELIIAAQGQGANLEDIIKAELAPYDTSRVSVAGPHVFLEPKPSLVMALLLHELATNASKYGALSRISGRVAIRWATADRWLNIEWIESGGPAAAKPAHHGFGSRLVTRMLASLGGSINARFEPTGLICDMSIELAEQSPKAAVATDPKIAAPSISSDSARTQPLDL